MAASNKLQLFPGGTPELVRTSQKDHRYNSYLVTLLSDITEPFLPRRHWLHWQREIQLVAEIMYYSLTTLSGNQTLGEEYCNMIQVTNERQVPSLLRRLISIGCHVVGRYILEKCLRVIKNHLARKNQNYLSNLFEIFEEILQTANQLHLAIFYMYGVYQWLGKRIAGIQYLLVRYQDWSPLHSNPYKLLGILILLQLIIKLGKLLTRLISPVVQPSLQNESLNSDEEENISEILKCSLCFECCQSPTVPPCGHMYCWKCITEWLGGGDNSHCPVCRRTVCARELVPLQQFNYNNN